MDDNQNQIKLSKCFDDGFNIEFELQNTSLSTNSREYQDKLSKGIRLLEDATRLINEMSMFSSNESINEVATSNLKYLLLPALLGSLTLNSTKNDRKEILNLAEIYFNDYIQRLNDYEVCDIEIKHSNDNENGESSSKKSSSSRGQSHPMSLEQAAQQRNDKIARYRQGKEFDERLKEMKQQIQLSKGNIDDELLRGYYLTLLKRWINKAQDELKSIEMEKPIVEQMAIMKALGQGGSQAPKSPEQTKLKPIIIVKNEMQKKVYGLGYPSVPTVSIDEFVSQKIEEGSLSVTNPIYQNSLLTWAEDPERKKREDEADERKKEKLIDEDDEIALKRAREFDEWKDEHRRGEGNRKNMG